MPSFTAITGTKTLDEFTAKNGVTTPKLSGTTFKLMMYGSKGNPLYVKDDTTLQQLFPDAYAKFGSKDPEGHDSTKELSFFWAEGGVNPGHWYMTCDTDREFNMDKYPLEQGRGYIVFCGSSLSKGVKLTESGAVGTADLPIKMAKSTYMLSGNIAPRDFKIKEFTVVNGVSTPKLSATTFKLLFFGVKSGNMMYVKDNTYLQEFCPKAYAKYGAEDSIKEFALFYAEGGTNPQHWYMTCDDEREFIMDDYVIKAGEGFEIFCGSSLTKGVTFTLPAALEAPAAE